MMQSPWGHTRQSLSWTVFSFIVFLKQTQNKCIKRLMHGCLIEVTTKKILVGMAKRWLWPLNGGWTACQEIIACHDFRMFTIVVAIYLLRPSLFSCHFFHNLPFWRAQKNCDPPLLSTPPSPSANFWQVPYILLSCSPGFTNQPSFPKNRPFYSFGL